MPLSPGYILAFAFSPLRVLDRARGGTPPGRFERVLSSLVVSTMLNDSTILMLKHVLILSADRLGVHDRAMGGHSALVFSKTRINCFKNPILRVIMSVLDRGRRVSTGSIVHLYVIRFVTDRASWAAI
jgi:hypothetical protein